MRKEIITDREDLLIWRLVLDPGETTSWHTDPCHRFSVVVRGERLTIEFRDGDEPVEVPVEPGLAGWDHPDPRVHRARNTGSTVYEEVVTFFRSGLDDPQPVADEAPE
ncbi:MAG TPA: hypothetical protein VF210_16600 [Pseudomonadales bacterium]